MTLRNLLQEASGIQVNNVREGCHPLGCAGESHDGTPRWVGDVPRTAPGVVGAETRHDGS